LSPIYQHSDQNGLSLATAQLYDVASIAIGLYLPVGSRYESEKLNGISHFVEHMIFKGTLANDGSIAKSPQDIAVAIESLGATVNAYTTEDLTCVELRGPVTAAEPLLRTLKEMVWDSAFDQEELEQERDVIEEEIIMYRESPSEHLHDLLSEALWNGHNLARPITGTINTISHITRQDLCDFVKTHYYRKGITLAVSSALSHESLSSLVSPIFPNLDQPAPILNTPSTTVTAVHETRDTEQHHLAIGYRTEGRHSTQRHSLKLLSLILGETMSSRLFQEIREKRGLCYHIASDYTLYEDCGSFTITAGIDEDRIDSAKSAIFDTIHHFRDHGPTQQELDQAIRFATQQNLINLEGTQALMTWVGDSVHCFSKIIDPLESQKSFESITTESIKLCAQKILSQPHALASIGP